MNPLKPFSAKPKREEDFAKPVAWLLGRDLIQGLKWIVLYTVFKGKLDPRDWMNAQVFPRDGEEQDCLEFWRAHDDENWQWKTEYDTFWAARQRQEAKFWAKKRGTPAEEFWFDFIADTGDGQISVYNVGYLCLSDVWTDNDPRPGSSVSFEQTAEHSTLLPRGQFLFVGGDTTYHIADYASLSTRFQQPLRWAFGSLRSWLQKQERLTHPLADDEGIIPAANGSGKQIETDVEPVDSEPRRPIFGIPGNHDYYDVIDGFNRQFRRPIFSEDGESGQWAQLSIPGFRREQDASYIGLRLPFEWWFWGLDTEVSKLDVRQRAYFLTLLRNHGVPNKLILATPEPTTVFQQRKKDDDKTLEAYEQLGLKQPYQAEADEGLGKCRLDLSGDVHHYARYYGPKRKINARPEDISDHYASVVAGGGGAFLHPSETVSKKGKTKHDIIEEQILHPPREVSHAEVASRLFDLRNIWHGGYVWLIGSVIAWIIYFASTVPQSSKNFLEWLLVSPTGRPRPLLDLFPPIPFQKDSDFLWLTLNFPKGIDLSGFRLATVFLFLSVVCLGVAIYGFSKLIKKLTNSPLVFDAGVLNQPDKRLPIHYRDLKSVGVWLLVGLGFYLLGVSVCASRADQLHPFGSSLLVVVHIILTIELLTLSVQNSAWLTHRPKFETGTKRRYVPVWILTALATLCIFFGIWMFGRYPGAYVLSDTIFTLVAILVVGGLTFVGGYMGGELQRWPGKIFLTVIGFWHGLLQVVVPLMLIRIGDWRAVALALVAILFFSGLSVPYTRIRINGLGARLMKTLGTMSQVLLTIFWFVYGWLLLYLPYKINSRRGILVVADVPKVGGNFPTYSSFLPQSVVDWVAANLRFSPYAPAWVLLIISLVAAVALGFILSMSFLSWYFAVSLAFQGHNNEVGGAARIEKFKHIVRIRLRKGDLTAFVIAIDNPKADADQSKPKLIDVFTLQVT
jgi:hypothetical protein